METGWLPSLKTATPEEGFALAVKLGRMAVKLTQPSSDVRETVRRDYERDGGQLIAISEVVAIHFQTIAAANNYWT
ncbi:MAG TPA: hexameric tyrosine-coordinated heme protein [Phenylobacterium sp.]